MRFIENSLLTRTDSNTKTTPPSIAPANNNTKHNKKMKMKVKIGSTAQGINWIISVPTLGITLSEAENIDTVEKLITAIQPLQKSSAACDANHASFAVAVDALVVALFDWETGQAVAAQEESCAVPHGSLKLSVKESPDGVLVNVIIVGFPGKVEAVVSTTHQIDQLSYNIIDMLESSGNGTSNEVITEIRATITNHWREWFGKYVILQGCEVGGVAKKNFGTFSASAKILATSPVPYVRGYAEAQRKLEAQREVELQAQAALDKRLANEELARLSPKDFHELAMGNDPESFMHKGKEVIAIGFNIGDAIQALEDGYVVTCEHWPKEVFLFMVTSPDMGFDDFIAMHTSQGDNTPWTPTQKSLVDRTWCVLA